MDNVVGRLSTYHNSPFLRMSLILAALSRAGFYYTGEGTTTVCFSCALVVLHWAESDDPFGVHRQRNPLCSYIIETLQKGLFTEYTTTEYTTTEYTTTSEDTQARDEADRPVAARPKERRSQKIKRDSGTSKSKDSSAEEDATVQAKISVILPSPIRHMVFELGYTRQQIERSVRQRLSDGIDDPFPNLESVLDSITDCEKQIQTDQREKQFQKSQKSLKKFADFQKKILTNSALSDEAVARPTDLEESPSNLEESDIQALETEVKKLEQQNSNLRDNFMCKVCLMNQVDCVILRCGHYTCCTTCVSSLTSCPFCREPIRGTVRVFNHVEINRDGLS